MGVPSRTGQEPPVLTVRSGPPFDSFYHREFPAIRAVVWALTGNVWTAEDVAQEAFLRAHRAWDRVSGYDEPGAWVRRVAINLATSASGAASGRYGPWPASPGAAPRTGNCPSPRGVLAAVRALPRQQAAVLALHYYEDLPIADIAGVLGLAEGTVKAHLHKGREALRRRSAQGRRRHHEPGEPPRHAGRAGAEDLNRVTHAAAGAAAAPGPDPGRRRPDGAGAARHALAVLAALAVAVFVLGVLVGSARCGTARWTAVCWPASRSATAGVGGDRRSHRLGARTEANRPGVRAFDVDRW
jgi:RNA polymerase sigma-70 factor (ECF subfamily)